MTVWDAGAKGPFDPVRFATSWLVSPAVLFGLRAFISLFIFVSLFTILGLDTPTGARHSFSYFTSLTFWGLGFYFAFAALHTWSYWWRGRPLLESWPRALQIAHVGYYTTVTTFPFIVTIVYWALIYDYLNGSFEIFSNTAQHVLNLVFCLFEILIPRTAPTPWIHLVTLVVILLLYLGLAYTTWGTAHFYVYTFLDDRIQSRGVIAGYILGILAMTILVFVIVHFVILGRVKVTEGKWGKKGKLQTRGSHRAEFEDIEVAEMGREQKSTR